MTSSISTSTVDSNLAHFFNQVGSIPSSARWQELFQLAADELGCPVKVAEMVTKVSNVAISKVFVEDFSLVVMC